MYTYGITDTDAVCEQCIHMVLQIQMRFDKDNSHSWIEERINDNSINIRNYRCEFDDVTFDQINYMTDYPTVVEMCVSPKMRSMQF